MNEYELTVLIHPDLESTLDSVLDKVRGLITSNGGETVKEDNWGKKKLAYQIKREDFAIYVCFDVKLPSRFWRLPSRSLGRAFFAFGFCR